VRLGDGVVVVGVWVGGCSINIQTTGMNWRDGKVNYHSLVIMSVFSGGARVGWVGSERFRQREGNIAGCGNELTCRLRGDEFGVNGDLRKRKLERVAIEKEKEAIVEWWWVR